MPKSILDRIEALGLHESDAATVRQIVRDAVDIATCPVEPSKALAVPGDWPADYREQFWKAFPRRTKKDTAMKALEKVAKAGKTRWADLINAIERYKLSRDVQRGCVMHPATWLNGGCWKDEEQTTPHPVGPRPASVGFFDGLDL